MDNIVQQNPKWDIAIQVQKLWGQYQAGYKECDSNGCLKLVYPARPPRATDGFASTYLLKMADWFVQSNHLNNPLPFETIFRSIIMVSACRYESNSSFNADNAAVMKWQKNQLAIPDSSYLLEGKPKSCRRFDKIVESASFFHFKRPMCFLESASFLRWMVDVQRLVRLILWRDHAWHCSCD